MQLFDSQMFKGAMLYFDLDVVIVQNIDWITQLPLRYFWAVKDFKYLWRPTDTGTNSSVMWWDTQLYDYVWRDISRLNLSQIMKKYRGDQDYITEVISEFDRRFLNPACVQSWRWQCLDGGYNFKQRIYQNPGAGTVLTQNTSVLVFHGQPKPSEVSDPVVKEHWR
jgi:lipopolysaccharide biosynthesis glycosyltransferase